MRQAPAGGQAGPPAWTPDPPRGRVFAASRAVRTTDVTPGGRLRLDAVARYLQEAAEDDVLDSGWHEPQAWLLRRCALVIRGYPRHGEHVALRTFCSGLGPRWAERTTTLSTGGRDLIQAAAVWVAIGADTGAPVPLGPGFHRLYGESALGRKVSARLSRPGPGPALPQRAWPLRACDFDPAGHVNNTVHWAALEDALAGADWLPASAAVEYHRPVLPGCEPRLVTGRSPGHLDVWLMSGPDVLAAGVLAPAGWPATRLSPPAATAGGDSFRQG